MNDIQRVFMYHGAEHKTIFCYENALDLTVENVRKMSRFHPRCGTSFMFVMIIISVLVSSALVLIFPELSEINRLLWIAIKVAILPIVMGLGYEFIKYASAAFFVSLSIFFNLAHQTFYYEKNLSHCCSITSFDGLWPG